MKSTIFGRSLVGFAVVAMSLGGFGVSPVLAQSESCTCVLPTSSVGSISSVSGKVYAPGSSGLELTSAGAALGSGSSVMTADGASANIDMGASCRFSMKGSMSMRVIPQEGGLCVQVYDDSVAPGVTGGVGTAAVVAAGAGVLVSLGFLASVSK